MDIDEDRRQQTLDRYYQQQRNRFTAARAFRVAKTATRLAPQFVAGAASLKRAFNRWRNTPAPVNNRLAHKRIKTNTKKMPRYSRKSTTTRKRKRTYRKRKSRYTKKKRSGFSSLGFTLHDKQKYTLDVGTTPITVPGFTGGSTFAQQFGAFIEEAKASRYWTVLGSTANTNAMYIYGRMLSYTDDFVSTSGIMEHFQKTKLARLVHKWKFPDQ